MLQQEMQKRAKNLIPEPETPQVYEWSIGAFQVLRGQRYTMEEIAKAFGVTRRTLYNRLDKQKAPTSEQERGISSPPDMDNGGLELPQFTRVPDLRQKTAPL